MGAAEALIAVRFWHYAAVLGLFGSALYATWAPGVGGELALRRLRFGWRLSAVSALISGALGLVLTAAAMAGDFAAALDPATLQLVLSGTGFGAVWLARLAAAAVLAILAFVAPSPRALAAGGALLLASLALTGHAAAVEGPLGWLLRTSDALHLIAAGAWLGALAAFAAALRSGDEAGAAGALTGFAGLGSVLVAVIVATGVLNGWLVLGSVEALWTTAYGRVLLAKVALFAGMLALAAANRFWLAPAFAANEADKGARLRLSIGVEQALGFGVLAAVAVLGTLDPAA